MLYFVQKKLFGILLVSYDKSWWGGGQRLDTAFSPHLSYLKPTMTITQTQNFTIQTLLTFVIDPINLNSVFFGMHDVW